MAWHSHTRRPAAPCPPARTQRACCAKQARRGRGWRRRCPPLWTSLAGAPGTRELRVGAGSLVWRRLGPRRLLLSAHPSTKHSSDAPHASRLGSPPPAWCSTLLDLPNAASFLPPPPRSFYSMVSAAGIAEGLKSLKVGGLLHCCQIAVRAAQLAADTCPRPASPVPPRPPAPPQRGGVPPRLLIIDDGWQQTEVDAPYRAMGALGALCLLCCAVSAAFCAALRLLWAFWAVCRQGLRLQQLSWAAPGPISNAEPPRLHASPACSRAAPPRGPSQRAPHPGAHCRCHSAAALHAPAPPCPEAHPKRARARARARRLPLSANVAPV